MYYMSSILSCTFLCILHNYLIHFCIFCPLNISAQ
nr:MAG TPA: hypothetical protein [Bacteriophage sp.]